MNASVLFNTIVGALLLPPLNLVIIAAFGLLLRRRWPRLGLAIGACALVLLVVVSTKAGARLLVAPLERMSVPLASTQGAGAIVVLGGGRIEQAPEYGGRDIPSNVALLRLRYAAKLHRETGLPILLSGGAPDGASESEAAVMARVLRDDYAIAPGWLEERSLNTAQNARYSAALLMPGGVRRIVLVTDAIHMPRAQAVFERTGFEVLAAPTVFLSRGELRFHDFIPEGEGFRRAHYAMHEWIGMLWYRLRDAE